MTISCKTWDTYVRPELQVRCPSLDILPMGVIQMAIENLFRQGQRAAQSIIVIIVSPPLDLG